MRILLAAAICALALLSGCHAGGLRGLLANKTGCNEQRIDAYYRFVVTSSFCNQFQPGNASLRGPSAGFPNVSECILVNNSMPGPIIRVKLGDWVQVDVTSYLFGRSISFHWHGLSMRGTPWSDGASFVSSCPLRPGTSASYVWQAVETGTYFYHGHMGLEEEYGMSGPLIIDDPSDPYTDLSDEEWPETVLEIRDWWREPDAHTSQSLLFRFYQQMDPQGVPVINGYAGGYMPSLNTQLTPPVFEVAVNTCYRIRWVLGNTEWPGFKVNFTDPSGKPMNQTLIALTAQDLKPKNVYNLVMYIAQRAETIFCTKDAGDYLLHIDSAQPENETYCPTNPSCYFNAVIRAGGITTNVPKTANRTKLASFPWYDTIDSLKRADLINPYTPVNVPYKADQVWMIYIAIVRGNMYAWTERNWGNMLPTAPLLFTKGGQCGAAPQYAPGQNISNVQKGYLQKTVKYGEVVDIVFNNLSPFIHPMHLHGLPFTVLGNRYYVDAGYIPQPQDVCPKDYLWATPNTDGAAGPPWTTVGTPYAFGCPYNDTQDNSQYFLDDPYTTDIVPIPAHGWSYTRVKFDNPGSWFLHCHLNIHMLNGMGFFVNVALDKVPKIPSWVDTSCGGPCMAETQICGEYTPTSNDLPKCSTTAKDNVCAPVVGGPGTPGWSG